VNEKNLSLIGHLNELRRILVVSGIALILGCCVALYFSDTLDLLLRLPIKNKFPANSQPVYLDIFEPIFYRLKLGLIGGIILASPVVFQQMWWFISPALYPNERRYALPVIGCMVGFFLGGVLFCYFLVLPTAVEFSVTQMVDNTRLMLALSSYLSGAAMFLIIFGLVFETPIVVVALSWLGIIKTATFTKYRKYVFLGIFIVSAIATPTPDIVNQSIMALPMYVLFELGVLAARMVEKRRFLRQTSQSANSENNNN
jgi:sec-independent protein translocase protein TatC